MSGWIQATMQQNTIVMDDPVGWQAHHAQAQAPASLQSFMTTAGSPNTTKVGDDDNLVSERAQCTV